eukprot:3371662-Karenia_brevis.AAC.1
MSHFGRPLWPVVRSWRFLGGPPCETFSAARSRVLEDGRRGPRALGTPGDIWGLRDLFARERRQVDLSNAFLRAMIRLMHVARATGVISFMEHPE